VVGGGAAVVGVARGASVVVGAGASVVAVGAVVAGAARAWTVTVVDEGGGIVVVERAS
jgi:hypothetical protein